MKNTYIIVLNWNGWIDTLHCLDSLMELGSDNFKIIICDNGSSDGSINHISYWLNINCKSGFNYVEIDCINNSFVNIESYQDSAKFIFIKNNSNLGYAGGNNVGIRFILENDHDYDFIWILNNDTTVDPDSLFYLTQRMRSDINLGICGSLLIHGDDHNLIQACGAKYNKLLSRPFHIAHLKKRSDVDLFTDCEIDFTVGASMMVSHSFISAVGLMCEDYFLYFEELDWITRAANKFKIAIEPLSIVYHKQGASTGASGMAVRRSKISQYYQARGRILYTKKFHYYFLPTVLFSIAVSLGFSLLRGDLTSAKSIILGALDGIIGIKGRRDSL